MEHQHIYKNLFGAGAVLLCFLLLFPSLRLLPVGAQTQLSDASREEFDTKILGRVEAFFDTLKRGPSAPAFDELLRGSPLGVPEAATQKDALRTTIDDLAPQFGNILAWERLDIRRIGTHIALVRYVLMYDNHALVWTFTFYRKPSSTPSITISTPNSWVLIELHFDTDMKKQL